MLALVYKSIVSKDFSFDNYQQIVTKSIDFNKTNNITGFLIIHKGHFLQLLEGDDKRILSLYDLICTDTRHEECSLISVEPINERMFKAWKVIFDDKFSSNKNITTSEKRKQFDDMYHKLNIIMATGVTKYALWLEVNKLFNLESEFSTAKR